MFSQELLTNGELNHFSLKERMVEIGKRWHKLSAAQKDKYKKLVEEQQVEYKVELEAWLKVRPPRPQSPLWSLLKLAFSFQSLSAQDRAVYKELSSSVSSSPAPPASSSSSASLFFSPSETPQHHQSPQQSRRQGSRHGQGQGGGFQSRHADGGRGQEGDGVPSEGSSSPRPRFGPGDEPSNRRSSVPLFPQFGLSGCVSLRLLAGHVRLGRGGGEERIV